MKALLNTYRRALGMLRSELMLTAFLVIANAVLAVLHLAEPILFGRVVDALAGGCDSVFADCIDIHQASRGS